MQFLLFNWYCNENENYGIMIARCANQADKIGLPPRGVGLYRQATA